jgi:predicted enzyme related to lactoylglutathione lyase
MTAIIRPKSEIGGDMGFFARVIDTEGNVIGLWSYK